MGGALQPVFTSSTGLPHLYLVTAASCAKYLCKYIAKGNDFAKARISGIKSEIEMNRTTRYISAAEATWKMLGFETNSRYPSVTRVHAH